MKRLEVDFRGIKIGGIYEKSDFYIIVRYVC